ncbi:MAG: DUF2341 domain-containing protein [Patescibacteria group bacterium]
MPVEEAQGAIKTWDFANTANIANLTYDNAKIEFVSNNAQLKAASNWYNSSWEYRKKFTIDHTKVGASLTDFTALINLSSDADLASKAQDDGNDILFTSSDGTTKLSHEIEKYTKTTGGLVAWVKIPNLSSSTNTDIYMYYGNAEAPDEQDMVNAWDPNYKMVNHMAMFDLEAYKQVSGYTAGSSDNYYITEPSVIYQNNTWMMWAHVRKFRSGAWHDDVWYFTSLDGVTWTEDSEALQDAYRPFVLWNAADNKYWMYATPDQTKINLYTSSNATGFTLDTNSCITTGAVYDQMVANNTVYRDGSTWHMIYEAWNGTHWGAANATSLDGRTWTKDTANPIVVTGWDTSSSETGPGYLTKIGNTFYLLIHGRPAWVNGSTFCGDDLYLLTSTDLHTFTPIGGIANHFISRTQTWEGAGNAHDGQIADPFMVEQGGYVYVTYEGISSQSPGPGTAHRIGTAKIPGTFATVLTQVASMLDSTTNNNNPGGGTVVASESLSPDSNGVAFTSTFANPSFVRMPDTTSLNISDNTPFTLEVRVKTPPGTNGMRLLSKRDDSDLENLGYELYLSASTNTLGWFIGDNTGNQNEALSGGTGTANLRTNTFHNIVLERDIANGKIKTFVDGVQEVNVALTKTGDISNTRQLNIGKLSRTDGENNNYFNGTINEIRLSNTARSAAWISTNYNNENSPSTFYSVGSEVFYYPADNPTIYPNSALTFTSLSGFTETATKNDGEIKYILSNNAGTNWMYYNGSNWVASNGAYSQSNTVSEINSHISSFPVGQGEFLWKAFLHSNGIQLVQLSSVGIDSLNNSGNAFTSPVKPIIASTDPATGIPSNVTQIAISRTPDFTNISWQPLDKDKFKNIDQTTETLYVKFRTDQGAVSDVVIYTPQVTNQNTVITLNDGDIVKTPNNPDVYVIKYKNNKQYKRLILSPLVFKSYRHLKWENIKIVSQEQLDKYIISNLVKETMDTIIYQLFPNGDTGERKEQDASTNYDPDSVYEINVTDRDSYKLVK